MGKAEVGLIAIICAAKFILRNVAGVALLSRIPSEREDGVKRCVREELDVEGRCALHNRKCARILSLTQSRQHLAARVGGADPSALARLRGGAWTDGIRGNLGGLRARLLQH